MATRTKQRIRRNEMARRLGISTRTLDRWTNKGVYGLFLRAVRKAGTTGYLQKDVNAFMRKLDAIRGVTGATA